MWQLQQVLRTRELIFTRCFGVIFSTMCAGEKYPLDGRSLSIPYETGTAEERGFSRLYCSYCAEKDEKYLGWFFHYYEPRLNTIIMQTVQETAMQGHFADLKQAYIFGIYKALQKYDISTGVPFLIFKEFYVKNEIDAYISTMRQGYSVHSVDEYRSLKKTMALYAKYECKFDEETIL